MNESIIQSISESNSQEKATSLESGEEAMQEIEAMHCVKSCQKVVVAE